MSASFRVPDRSLLEARSDDDRQRTSAVIRRSVRIESASVVATSGHPFWVSNGPAADAGRFVDAGHLRGRAGGCGPRRAHGCRSPRSRTTTVNRPSTTSPSTPHTPTTSTPATPPSSPTTAEPRAEATSFVGGCPLARMLAEDWLLELRKRSMCRRCRTSQVKSSHRGSRRRRASILHPEVRWQRGGRDRSHEGWN